MLERLIELMERETNRFNNFFKATRRTLSKKT